MGVCQAAPLLRAARSPALSADDGAAWRERLARRRPPRRARGRDRLVLLGTAGGSNPKATRCGYANALVVDGAAYLVDCGEGANTQLWRAGVVMNRQPAPPGKALLSCIFLTHLHSDHLIDYPNLFLGTWPNRPVEVYGPGPAGLPIPAYPPDRRLPPPVNPADPTPGTRATTDLLLRAFAYNINVRVADEGRPYLPDLVSVREIGVSRAGYRPDIDLGVVVDAATPAAVAPAMEPVEIRPTDRQGVRVSAVLVQHAPIFPALAYRFDTPGGSVVFSGDTGPCENLVRLARGADVLVHEVIDLAWMRSRLARMKDSEAVLNHLASAHSSPAQVGDVAGRAGVRTVVLSHLVPGDGELDEEAWESQVRAHFAGDVVCGVDLDEFDLDGSVAGSAGPEPAGPASASPAG